MAANKKCRSRAAFIVFCVYIAVLIYILFFAENMGRTGAEAYRYNYIPFKEIKRFVTHVNVLGPAVVLANVLGNVLVFVPFGYFVPRLVKNGMGVVYTTILSMEFSAIIEIMQLITKTGSCDIDDVILNTIGGIVGYILFYIIRRLHPDT